MMPLIAADNQRMAAPGNALSRATSKEHAMRDQRFRSVVLATALSVVNGGCPVDGDSTAAGAAATGGAPAEGGAGGGCPSGSHSAESGGCVSTLAFTRSKAELPAPRDHHTTLVAEPGGEPYLYVFGGGTDGNTTIGSDGSLGAFEEIGELPEPRLGHTTVLIGNRVIVSGGLSDGPSGLHALRTTAIATLTDDGALGPWSEGPDLPQAVMHHSCNAYGSQVICIGGRIAGNYTSDLAVRAELAADGTLTPYQAVSQLSASIGFHQAFIRDRALYIAGGLHRDAPMPDFDLLTSVWRAEIGEDGSLGPWVAAGELPAPMNVGAAELFLDRVYWVGGMHGVHGATASVLESAFRDDGSVADVVTSAAKLSAERMHVHQTPVYKTWIYAVGGRDTQDASLASIDIGTFE
jgi:hypothetical protein